MSEQWKQKLRNFVEATNKTRLPAGDVYRHLGLPSEKQKRSAAQSVVVQSLMKDLGWIYKGHGTRPCFILQEKDSIIEIIEKQKALPLPPTRNLVGLTDRHLHALKIVEESWTDCGPQGVSADFLAARLGLVGKDTRRIAQHVLESLAKRKLVVKTIRSTVNGKVARYLPTGLTTENFIESNGRRIKDQALFLLLQHAGKSFTRDNLCHIVERDLPCPKEEACAVIDMLLRQKGQHFSIAYRSHNRAPLYTIIENTGKDEKLPLSNERQYVYFIQWSNDASHVKIGYSSTPLSRFTTFLTSSPHKLFVLGLMVVEGQEEEAFLHSLFEEYRVTGEWFQYEGKLRSFIESLPRHTLESKMRALLEKYKDRIESPCYD